MTTAATLRSLIRATLFAALTAVTALAADSAPPEHMTYQGYLVDGNGVPLGSDTPKNYDVIFRIGDDTTNIYWSEYQTVTVDKGYFSVLLGEGTQVGSEPRPALSSVFRGDNADTRYIGFTVKGIGSGTSPDVELKPRVQLLTAPYSFLAHHAVNAANLVDEKGAETVSVLDGMVGINTGAPTAALDVNGSIRSSGSLETATVALGEMGHPGWAGFAHKAVAGPNSFALLQSSAGTDVRINAIGGASSQILFSFDNTGSALTVRPNGTVTADTFDGKVSAGNLVGTVGDNHLSGNVALLDIDQSFHGMQLFEGGFQLGADTIGNDHHMFLRGPGDHNHGLGWVGSVDGPALYGYSGGVLQTTVNGTRDVLTWNRDGHVGIGTAAPGRALHLVSPFGDDRQLRLERAGVNFWDIGVDLFNNFHFLPNGGPLSYINPQGVFLNASDERLKKEIANIESPLEKVLQLRPVSYRYKTSAPDSARSLGFIAQEIEGVLPEVTSELNGMKSVSYTSIIPVAVGAIKELHAESERKQQQIDELKRELQELRATVEKLARNSNTASSR